MISCFGLKVHREIIPFCILKILFLYIYVYYVLCVDYISYAITRYGLMFINESMDGNNIKTAFSQMIELVTSHVHNDQLIIIM